MIIKKSKIPTILGLVILVVGIFAGVFFLNMNQVFRIGADTAVTPKDIRTSNISDNSVTVSWTTDKESADFLTWGENQGSVNKVEKESQSDEKFFTHSVTLTGLKPATTYFYKINSEGTNFDNKGIPWEFTTGASLEANKNSLLISGSIIRASGQPEKRALVYANIGGYMLSTLTSDTGNFVFQLGSVRGADLQNYAQIDKAQTLVEISVQAGPNGVASATVFPQSAKPIPPIILGQIYDFRNLPPAGEGQIPTANLNLPAESSQESKFSIPPSSGSPAPTSVILENIKEGETVTSTKPEFFGKGPGGQVITITIESESPIQGTVQIPQNGSWSYSPPENLAPGAHTITISWKDATGITRSLTRSFIVQASELPAFESTPSQTLAPTPTGTPVVTASPSPAPPIPQTGSLTPTILLSIMGLAVLLFSFTIWKLAEENARS